MSLLLKLTVSMFSVFILSEDTLIYQDIVSYPVKSQVQASQCAHMTKVRTGCMAICGTWENDRASKYVWFLIAK
jgi:hypothetical protein